MLYPKQFYSRTASQCYHLFRSIQFIEQTTDFPLPLHILTFAYSFFHFMLMLKKLYENVVLRLSITLNAYEKQLFTYLTCTKPIRPALNVISNKKIISSTPILFRQPWTQVVRRLILRRSKFGYFMP